MEGIVVKIMRNFAVCCFLCICMFGISGCGYKENEKITIWAYDYYIDAAKEAVKLYEQDHPEVSFDIVELGQDDMVEKLRISLASGDMSVLPDIICEEDYNLKGYIEYYEECFVDLSNYVDPSLYVDFKVNNVTYNGKIWAIPYDTGVATWFYRKDILEEAGFEEKDLENITWDRFIEIGKVVKEKTGKYMIPLLPDGNIEGRIILQSTGKWYYNDNGDLDIKDNQAIIDMSRTLKALHSSGVIYEVASWDDIIASFYNGKTAGVIGGSWWAPTIAANDEQFGLWRATSIPRMGENDMYSNYSTCGGCSWFVLNTKNKEKAIDFLMETIAVDTEISNVMLDSKFVIPALKTASNVEKVYKEYEYFDNQALCTQMVEWSQNIPYVNYDLHSYEIAYYHGSLFNDYFRDEISLEEMIEKLQQEAERIIAE